MASPQVMVTRVPHNVLRSRIDSGFYAPEHLERERRLRQLGVLRPAIGESASLVTDGTHKTTNYVENGVAFLSARNIYDNALSFADHRFVSRVEFLQLRAWNCAPLPNDILVAKSGSIGNAAVVPAHAPEFAVFESIAIVRCDRFDPYYLATFLNSRIGQQEIKRQTKGAVIRHLHLEDLRDVEIPEFTKDAQRYVGDKVRQAEGLRGRACRLEAEVRRSYRMEIDRLGYVEVPHRKSFRTKLRDRLDPAYYDPAFTSVLDAPWLTRNSVPLSRFFSEGSYGDLPDSGTYGTGGKWLIRATDLNHCMTHWDTGLRVPAAEVSVKSEVRENDILLEVKGAIEKCAIGRGPAVGKHVNGTVFRLSPNGINAGYLCLHLTAEIKRKYAAREAVNNIIQYLNLDCIRALPVLRLDVDLEGRLGGSFIEAVDARTAATTLTGAATTLVEQLIDGRVNQADIVAAQKALDAGDRRADREILQGLRQSDAPDARPLIADVDALYALLDGSEADDT